MLPMKRQYSEHLFKTFDRVYRCDWLLLTSLFLLAAIGCVMMASASYEFSAKHFEQHSFLLERHFLFLMLGVSAATVCFLMPLNFWQKTAPWLLCLSFFLLLVILIPDVGHGNKGAVRWLKVGGFTVQVSEVTKFCLLAYLASYLVRQQDLVRNTLAGFLNPLIVLGMLVVLLLAEPDFGAVVVLLMASMGLLFLGGVKLGQFITLLLVSMIAMVVMIFTADYRMQRFLAYLDPWEHRLDGGYQLIESLIAVGRGEWFGAGLGNGVQKQFYLPEAHNDFIFAVICEELGFVGAVVVIALFVLLTIRVLAIARCAEYLGQRFGAYFCYGVALILFIQLFINVGVNTGLLPTKGLTLPFLSYGGSSLLVSFAMLGVVLRVNRDLVSELQALIVRQGGLMPTDIDKKINRHALLHA